ncbi:MAG: protein-glutamate O-methyltransferase CheR [Bacteroidota bacterium]|nr:protein-glutamate O-methyltransferase CheR [Candidatus Kapabacteria bacterium]MDW8219861.1 protein-glutamate O-methyltransferase CheR [Bacteroidota bacterium]
MTPNGAEEFVAVPLQECEFEKLRRLVHERFGIVLPTEKRTMVAVRLQKVLRRMHLRSFRQYYEYLVQSHDYQALIEFANAITINHTFFFREKEHFDMLVRNVLPEMSVKLKRHYDMDFRVWCAGCSSGEEAYTLSMVMQEFWGSEYVYWQAGVLATDISEKVLSIAMQGIYDEERVALVPPEYKAKYFQRLRNGYWQVKPIVRHDVLFRKFNLMNQHFPFKKPFHVIFCRNVMIYFDKPTRDALVQRFYDVLTPGGYLFIGHAETIDRSKSAFEYLAPAFYRKPVS